MNCACAVVSMPRRRWRVVCGRLEVMAMRAPTRALSKVDLPTFGLPTIATWPQRNAGVAIDSAASGLFIGLCRRRLLGGATARTGALRRDVQRLDATDNLEGLQMRLAVDGNDGVFGHGEASALQPFLQPRLRILGNRVGRRARHVGGVDALDGGMGSLKAAVEQDGTEQGLERVSKDRRPGGAAAPYLPLAELEHRPEVKRHGVPVQRIAIDEACAHPRQVALGQLREAVIEHECDGAIEHAIADEFEPFVMIGGEAAMRKRLA